jgi:MFS-type transporter involved in bile tolerance (Atg22 family)
MPAFAADFFGPKNVGPIYGLMLTAWDFASAFGPLLIAHMRETAGSYRGGFHVIAGVMAISTLLPILVRPPRNGDTNRTEIESHPLPKEVDVIASRVTTANPPHAQ